MAAFCGLHLFLPEVKGRLFSSSLALRGWKRLVPPVSHPPLSWDLAVVIAVRLAAVGLWSSGVGVLLSFDSYLRIGELTRLRKRRVAFDLDVRVGSAHRGTSLGLRRTKTGPFKWVNVRSPVVQTLLRQLVGNLPDENSRLFPCASAFYRHFKRACADLGLSKSYVPHSLRHGGATHDFLRGLSLEDILHIGRWASIKSARHYVQEGRALLLSTSVPRDVSALSRVLVPRILLAMSLTQ